MSQASKDSLENSHRLMDLVTPETGENELKQLVAQFISPDEEKLLGGKDESISKLADSVAYLGAFAPLPGTFDEEAFFRTATLRLPKEESVKLLEMNKRMGVIQDVPGSPGRMSVSKELVNAAKNQFLTKD